MFDVEKINQMYPYDTTGFKAEKVETDEGDKVDVTYNTEMDIDRDNFEEPVVLKKVIQNMRAEVLRDFDELLQLIQKTIDKSEEE